MAKKLPKGKKPTRRLRAPRPLGNDNERKLLNLILDPCNAEFTTGFAMSTTGIVQRFTKFIVPVATTENAFAYIWSPQDHGTSTAIQQKLAVGTGVPTKISSDGPGEDFINANADTVSSLSACMEVLYTGTLVNRKGYIGVCQLPHHVAADVNAANIDLPTLMTYCQAISTVPSAKIEVKWSPSLTNFTGNGSSTDAASTGGNCLMVVAVGVNPNDFLVRFTGVYEYVPKYFQGVPAPRVTKQVPVGVGERIVSALDRLGVWWHNLSNVGSNAMRMGYAMHAGNQLVRNGLSTARMAGRAYQMLEPATALLALTG